MSPANQPEHERAEADRRTAKEVAVRAGVSVTTVSRVLNGHGESISESTRGGSYSAGAHVTAETHVALLGVSR